MPIKALVCGHYDAYRSWCHEHQVDPAHFKFVIDFRDVCGYPRGTRLIAVHGVKDTPLWKRDWQAVNDRFSVDRYD